MKLLPWLFISSRFLSGLLFILFPLLYTEDKIDTGIVLTLLSLGFFGDILDGIIARRMNTDTVVMRKSDSIADIFFWVGITFYIHSTASTIQSSFQFGLISIGSILIIDYLYCLIKFKKTPSAHALFLKFWGILIFLFYFVLLMGYESNALGYIVFGIGVFARLESFLIYVVLKHWTHDVPTLAHAYQLRQNKVIRKNKLFNSDHK